MTEDQDILEAKKIVIATQRLLLRNKISRKSIFEFTEDIDNKLKEFLGKDWEYDGGRN